MKTPMKLALAGGLLAVGAGTATLLPGEMAQSADHLDPPTRTDPSMDSTPDRAADIADIYAWADGGNLNIALTFAGPVPTDQPATYDRDVLYSLNISTGGNPINVENVIQVRFGEASAGQFGVEVQNVPLVGTLSGPVEQTLTRNGASVRAGLYDDPFFFDLQGFQETLSTGALQFDSNRDFFANSNVTAVVLQVPLVNFSATGDIAVWSETARFGGNF